MENKKLKREHEVFIHEMIEHGDRNRAYRKAYPETESDIYGSAYRLSRRPDVSAKIEEARSIKDAEMRDRIDEEHYQRMLSIEKKRSLLSKAINGELKFEKLGHDSDGPVVVQVAPSLGEICKAIDTDNRLAREIAAIKQKLPTKYFIDDEEFS